MKRYLTVLFALLLTACDAFDFHPYDVDIDGEQGINRKNIPIIERQTMGKDTLRVVFTGDTQGWLDETRDMVKDINLRADSIDFVVINGDIADFGLTNEFEWMRDEFNRLRVPYVCVLGNHDCLGTGRQAFHNIFGEDNYSFIAARVKFVCMNTNSIEFDYSEAVPNFSFLETEAKADTASFDRTVFTMHAAPYSDEFNNNVAKPFEYYLWQFPQPLFCAVAHDHHFGVDDLFHDGLMYIMSDAAKYRGYNLITITPSGYRYEHITF